MKSGPLERIRAYLERAKQKNRLYPLEEKGIFKIMGYYEDWLENQDRDYDPITELGTVEGRFVDVVAYATQLKDFGRIEKVDVKQIKVLNKDLASIVTNYEKDSEEVAKSLGELENEVKNK